MANDGLPPSGDSNTQAGYCGACGGPCRCKQFQPWAASSEGGSMSPLDKAPLDKGHPIGGGK